MKLFKINQINLTILTVIERCKLNLLQINRILYFLTQLKVVTNVINFKLIKFYSFCHN